MDSSDDQEIEGVAELVSPIRKNKRGKVSTYYNMKYNYYSKLLHTFFYKNFFYSFRLLVHVRGAICTRQIFRKILICQ